MPPKPGAELPAPHSWAECKEHQRQRPDAEEHTVVLTSRRMPPLSIEQLLSLGIHPERKALLIVKGVVAPRAAYEPVAGEIMLVDTPGVTGNNPRQFTYARRRRPLFPLEMDAAYGPSR